MDYIGEIALALVIVILKLFGRTETAEKIEAKKKKKAEKLEKTCAADIEKLKRDSELLEKVKKELEK